MADLIDRQAAVSICDNAIDLWNGQLGVGVLVAVRDAIKALPSVDAVEVVRCKDCKYGRYDIADRGMYCGRKNVTMDTYEDDFCSRGERKDG